MKKIIALALGALLSWPVAAVAAPIEFKTVTVCNGQAYNVGASGQATGLPTGEICVDIGSSSGAAAPVIGSTTAADGATLTSVLKTYSLGGGYNGATIDMLRSGDVNNIATATGYFDSLMIGRYNATPPTLTDTRYNALQVGLRGGLHVDLYAPDTSSAISIVSSPGDAVTNAVVGYINGSFPFVFNGTSWDRTRSILNATNSVGVGIAAVGLVAQFDDASTSSVTENQFANLRMSSDHALLTSAHPYTSDQTPITGNAAGSTGAVVGTLAGVSGKTTYICGFDVSATGGVATLGPITIAGLVGSSMVYQLFSTATGAQLQKTFTPCIPASAANTAITITTTADATASAVDVNSWGFQQ